MLKLRTDQVAELAHYISQPKCLDLSDPGTGKTPPVCVNQYRRVIEGKGRTLWTMPKSLMAKNKQELIRFTPFNDNDVAIVDGTKRQVDTAMNSGAQVLIMGPDRFKRSIRDIPRDVKAMDTDEFHMAFGGAGTNFDGFSGSLPSGRVAAFYEFMGKVDEGVMMTGSLVNGGLGTAYPAIHAIDQNYYPFGYDQFLGAHAYMDERGKPYAWHSHDRVRSILGRHGFRKTFAQIFGTQEIVFETHWVEMNAKQRSIYDQFERDAYLELDDFMIDGTLPGVATTRARQIMEHPNHFRDLRDPYNLPHVDIMPGERPAKLEDIEIMLTDHNRNGTPVIIFGHLVPHLLQIQELCLKVGRRSGLMYGETSDRRRNEINEDYISGGLDTIVASWPTAAVGWNWQFCGEQELDHVIAASLSYKDTDFSQGWKRGRRGVRTKPLRVTTQAYTNSIDRRVMDIQIQKSKDANLVDPTQDVVTFSSHEESYG